jgi:DNA primase
MGRIPQRFIDELLERTDIVELIDSRVPLKRRGKEHWACCPFHNEKTPSFSVSGDKQFYHCFGCGVHGTAISFLMEYERLEFPEAIETLASMAGLEVPREGGEAPAPRKDEDLYDLLGRGAAFYRQRLKDSPQAIDYLKQRGLSGETAAAFGIGFAPPGWDALLRALGGDGQAIARLDKGGMLIRRESGGHYDRFRNRIMFPIRDRRGRVVGFGGRVIEADDGPKYLNSPETEVFHKGREIYGLYEARQHEPRPGRLIIVEGYMDVVALAEHGIRNAVATLGTAIAEPQVETLYRSAPELVFCFDGDEAGRRAARRAMEATLPALRAERSARFLFLPEGEDPDSFVRRHGPEAFREGAENAIALSDFLLQWLREQADTFTAEGRARLIELARPLVRRIPSDSLQLQLIEQLARETRTTREAIERLIADPGRSTSVPPARPGPRWTPVRLAINLLLHRPELAAGLSGLEDLDSVEVPGVDLLRGLLEVLRVNPHVNLAAILERFRGMEQAEHLARLAEWEPPGSAEEMPRMLEDCLARLRSAGDDQRAERLLRKSREGAGLDEAEKAELRRLLARRSGAGESGLSWRQ